MSEDPRVSGTSEMEREPAPPSSKSFAWVWSLVALIAVVALGTLAARTFYGERQLREHEFAGSTMGTTWSLKVVLPDGAPQEWIEAFRDTARSRLERVSALMSTWDPESELSRLNRSGDTTPQPVSPETFEVLSVGRDVGLRSGGALDVTVAPFVEAWGFGAGEPLDPPRRPDQAILAALAELVGPDRFDLDEASLSVTRRSAGVAFDVSAVAKGYGVDRVADGMIALGASAFAVEVGGEVRVGGSRPDGSAWRVAVEAPVADVRRLHRVIELRDDALATSGDYRNFFELDGFRYAHIVDPRTGRPVPWHGFSVTVIHEQAAHADAWATALSVLGPVEGLRLAEEHELAVLFVTREDGTLVEAASPAMRSRLEDTRP